MNIKKILIGVVTVAFGVPLTVLLTIVTTIHVLNRTTGSITSSGERREYLLHVPKSYDPAKPTPLVISMHGAAGWPAQQRNLSRWNRVADAYGFIVVYPAGTNTPRIWRVEPGPGPAKDTKFISDLIDTLEAVYRIDSTRIFANGISNGGGMSFVLSCLLPNRIAAVGLVSAAQTLPSSWCASDKPVPMIAFHGMADPIVPYDGGLLGDPFNPVKVAFPSVRDWVAAWAHRNRCAPKSIDSEVAPDATRALYIDCESDAAVVLYSMKGDGHTWPGGKPLPAWWLGRTSTDVDASATMWEFFQQHPLRETRTASH